MLTTEFSVQSSPDANIPPVPATKAWDVIFEYQNPLTSMVSNCLALRSWLIHHLSAGQNSKIDG